MREVVKAGKVTADKGPRGRTVDPLVADQEWLDNVDHRSRPRSLDDPGRAPISGDGDDADDLDGEVNEDNAGRKLRVAEAKNEIWKAKLSRLNFEEKAGHIVSADKVQRDAFEVARIFRDAVLVLPDRLSPELIGLRDQATMHAALTKALNAALTELTNGLEKRFGVPSGVSGGGEAGSAADGQ